MTLIISDTDSQSGRIIGHGPMKKYVLNNTFHLKYNKFFVGEENFQLDDVTLSDV